VWQIRRLSLYSRFNRSKDLPGLLIREISGPESIANGYWHARRLTFLMGGTYHKLEWLRMVGDMVFLLAGALPIAIGALRSVWKRDLSPTEQNTTGSRLPFAT
jgi:hypothetical protein